MHAAAFLPRACGSQFAHSMNVDNRFSEFSAMYASELQDLKVPTKSKIIFLTELAKDNLQAASAIAGAIENHVLTCEVENKLPGLYVLDSIAKNVQDPYISIFSRNLVQVYCRAFEAFRPFPRLQAQLHKLFQTWNGVFPKPVVESIQSFLERAAPAPQRPLTGNLVPAPQPQATSAVVNPAVGPGFVGPAARPVSAPLTQPHMQPRLFAPTQPVSAEMARARGGVNVATHMVMPGHGLFPPDNFPSLPVAPVQTGNYSAVSVAPSHVPPVQQLFAPVMTPQLPQAPRVMHQVPFVPSALANPQPAAAAPPKNFPQSSFIPQHSATTSVTPQQQATTSVTPQQQATTSVIPQQQATTSAIPQQQAATSVIPQQPATTSALPGNLPELLSLLQAAVAAAPSATPPVTVPPATATPPPTPQHIPSSSTSSTKLGEFNSNRIKEYNTNALEDLMLKTQQTRDKLLDQLFLQRHRLKSIAKPSRRWFVNLDSWLAGTSSDDQSEQAVQMSAQDKVEEEVSVPVDDQQTHCAISGERFEKFWDNNLQEWRFRNAVRLDGAAAERHNVPEGSLVLASCVLGSPVHDDVLQPASAVTEAATDVDIAHDLATAVATQHSNEKVIGLKRAHSDEDVDAEYKRLKADSV